MRDVVTQGGVFGCQVGEEGRADAGVEGVVAGVEGGGGGGGEGGWCDDAEAGGGVEEVYFR